MTIQPGTHVRSISGGGNVYGPTYVVVANIPNWVQVEDPEDLTAKQRFLPLTHCTVVTP